MDRIRQLSAFQKMLDGQTPRRIMVMTAGPGMGKSWMLRAYAQHAREKKVPVALFNFADGNAYDALALVTRSRDMLAPDAFERLNQTILEAANPQIKLNLADVPTAPIDVNLSGATVDGSVNINQGAINITNNRFTIQTNDPLIRRAIEDRITTVFFENLAELTARHCAVFLFDGYERLIDDEREWNASPVNHWIVDELLARMRDNRLPNAIAVLAGQSAPEFDVEWNEVLGRISLEPLTCDDVSVYLRERRGLRIITEAELARLCQAVGGNPSVLGIVGDNLEQANKPVPDDEW